MTAASPDGDAGGVEAPGAGAPASAALPAIADGVERPLDPRLVGIQRVVGWIMTGSIAFGLLVTAIVPTLLLAPLPWWGKGIFVLAWAALTAALGWFCHRWPAVAYRHAAYAVDAQGIEIRRGVVWRKVINVPRSRVQHTDVSQGPLERTHGLGTLAIYTAGTDHAKVDLAGLEHGTALRIRDHLLPREGDDAV